MSAYFVFAQDQPTVWIWLRESGAFSLKPKVLKGLDAVIDIAPLRITLPLAEIYTGFSETGQ